jgi:hypothetical protein
MGADLLMTYIEIKEPREKAKERLDKLVITEEDLERFDSCGSFEFEDQEFSSELALKVKTRLGEILDSVYDFAEGKAYSREITTFDLDGDRKFLITGGMSWGEDPTDYFTDFWIFYEFLGYPSHASPDSEEVRKWKEEVNA